MAWNPYRAPESATPPPAPPPPRGIVGIALSSLVGIGAGLLFLLLFAGMFIEDVQAFFLQFSPQAKAGTGGILVGLVLAFVGAVLMRRFPDRALRCLSGAVAVFVLASLGFPYPQRAVELWGLPLLAALHTLWRARKHVRATGKAPVDA